MFRLIVLAGSVALAQAFGSSEGDVTTANVLDVNMCVELLSSTAQAYYSGLDASGLREHVSSTWTFSADGGIKVPYQFVFTAPANQTNTSMATFMRQVTAFAHPTLKEGHYDIYPQGSAGYEMKKALRDVMHVNGKLFIGFVSSFVTNNNWNSRESGPSQSIVHRKDYYNNVFHGYRDLAQKMIWVGCGIAETDVSS